MKSANESVFQKLSQIAAEDVVDASRAIKYISSTSDEQNWLKNVKFVTNEDLYIDRHRFFALAELNREKYLLQVGFDIPVSHDEDLVLIQNNSGLFVALVSDLDLPVVGGAIKASTSIKKYSFHHLQGTKYRLNSLWLISSLLGTVYIKYSRGRH